MKTNEMIERYIYAVTKSMAAKKRQDVAKELESLIYDMLDERCGDIVPCEHDVRVVLTEIGTPNQLREKYSDNETKCLIGQPYYSQYILVLKVVLSCVAGVAFIAGIFSILENSASPWYINVLECIGNIIIALTFAFTFITIIFAVFHRKDIKIDMQSDSLDSLPAVPQKKYIISKGESIFEIVMSIVFMVILLGVPQVFSLAFWNDGVPFPEVFNADIIRSSWYIIIAFGIIGVGSACVKLIDGKYTKKVMAVTIVSNSICSVLATIWLTKFEIISSEFLAKFGELFQGEEFLVKTSSHFQLFILGVILLALILETVTTVVKTVNGKNEL